MNEVEVRKLLEGLIIDNKLSKAILSNRRRKTSDMPAKVLIKPFDSKGDIKYQFERYYDNKVMHENALASDTAQIILEMLKNEYRQGDIKTLIGEYQVLVSKKGDMRIKQISKNEHLLDLSHNRIKNYILKDGEPVDFLIKLGVMSPEGAVYKKKYDKFKQINKFLELVDDIAEEFEKTELIKIVDFGCGKSYLTFALYYYLVNIKNKKIDIIGMDLKKDVIDFCNKTAEELSYNDLSFICGDIAEYEPESGIDLVVTLHACDNATDIALSKAVKWGAKAIMSVPCCQHELFDKIKNNNLEAMLKHGIIKEKLSSLVTDSLRGSILEILGYRVQLLEFVDMEHTPKNIMIRAVKDSEPYDPTKINEYIELKKAWGLEELFIEAYLGDNFKVSEEG